MANEKHRAVLAAVQDDNKRLMDEIQKLMMHNTKLQRELMTLNASREQIVSDGHERVAALTEELKEVDAELKTVRGDCDRILAVVCQSKGGANFRSLGDLRSDFDTIEEEDMQSYHSTASTASTSSFKSSATSARGDLTSRSNSVAVEKPKSRRFSSAILGGRPPLSKKMSIDIDAERVEHMPHLKKSVSMSIASESERETVMIKISRSVKKAQSMPDEERPSLVAMENHSPMLTYKSNAVFKATQTHLNNFRRHSGPLRRNRDTVVL